jgi:hypothetical protein
MISGEPQRMPRSEVIIESAKASARKPHLMKRRGCVSNRRLDFENFDRCKVEFGCVYCGELSWEHGPRTNESVFLALISALFSETKIR